MSRWLCLGSGPSSKNIPPEAVVEHVATCNYGLEIFPAPDLFFMAESWVFRRYKEKWMEARRRGTRLITVDSHIQKQHQANADEILPVKCDDEWDVESWRPGIYRHALTTGSFMVQYVANHGATEINLVGFDGYPLKRGPDTVIKTKHYQSGLLKRMAEMLPDVKFIFWSRPNYEVADTPNVIVHDLEVVST